MESDMLECPLRGRSMANWSPPATRQQPAVPCSSLALGLAATAAASVNRRPTNLHSTGRSLCLAAPASLRSQH